VAIYSKRQVWCIWKGSLAEFSSQSRYCIIIRCKIISLWWLYHTVVLKYGSSWCNMQLYPSWWQLYRSQTCNDRLTTITAFYAYVYAVRWEQTQKYTREAIRDCAGCFLCSAYCRPRNNRNRALTDNGILTTTIATLHQQPTTRTPSYCTYMPVCHGATGYPDDQQPAPAPSFHSHREAWKQVRRKIRSRLWTIMSAAQKNYDVWTLNIWLFIVHYCHNINYAVYTRSFLLHFNAAMSVGLYFTFIISYDKGYTV